MEEQDGFMISLIHKNCRNFHKRIYDLEVEIDDVLPNQFTSYGTLNINYFSKFSKTAKDMFEIKNSDGTEITGVIGDKSIYFVTPKNNPLSYLAFEKIITNYIIKKREA